MSALFPKMVAAGHHELRQGRRGNFKCDKISFCFNYSSLVLLLHFNGVIRISTLVSVALTTDSLPIELNLNQTNPMCHLCKKG